MGAFGKIGFKRSRISKRKKGYSIHHVHKVGTVCQIKQRCFHEMAISVVVHVQARQKGAMDGITSIHH